MISLKKIYYILLCASVLNFGVSISYADTSNDQHKTIRVGVLKSGSVHWEIDNLLRHGFDEQNDIHIEPVILGSVNALLLALQGHSVDMIVGNWIWVARQYQQDRQFMFYPFSNAAGGLLAHPDKNIKSLTDLKNKKLGVAGGSEGKSWLLLRAYAQKKHEMVIDDEITVKFVAPPLVNALIQQNKLDAGLNFWHLNAAMNDKGYQTLLTIHDVLAELGVSSNVPMIGWIFHKSWAQDNADVVNRFLEASSQSKQLLLNSDDAWQALRPLMRAESDDLFAKLISGFRQGIPAQFSDEEISAMSQVSNILRQQGAVGIPEQLPTSIFWKLDKIDGTAH